MMTTAKRTDRCPRCSRKRYGKQFCSTCTQEIEKRNEAERAQEDVRRRLAIESLKASQSIDSMRAAMTPITRAEKKLWRCKGCGAACVKRRCVLCEREMPMSVVKGTEE